MGDDFSIVVVRGVDHQERATVGERGKNGKAGA
jgi:hypothetical protein